MTFANVNRSKSFNWNRIYLHYKLRVGCLLRFQAIAIIDDDLGKNCHNEIKIDATKPDFYLVFKVTRCLKIYQVRSTKCYKEIESLNQTAIPTLTWEFFNYFSSNIFFFHSDLNPCDMWAGSEFHRVFYVRCTYSVFVLSGAFRVSGVFETNKKKKK